MTFHPRTIALLAPDLNELARFPSLNPQSGRVLSITYGGHCVANRHKPSGIEDKRSKLRVHLVPAFGTKRLDAITSEDVQRLKVSLLSRSPKTVNNIMTVLRSLLKTAVAWGVIDRMPCAVPEVKAPKPTMGFLDFDEFERLVSAASAMDATTLLIVLLAGEAGLRAGEIMGAATVRRGSRAWQAARGAVDLEGPRHGAEGRQEPLRAHDPAARARGPAAPASAVGLRVVRAATARRSRTNRSGAGSERRDRRRR